MAPGASVAAASKQVPSFADVTDPNVSDPLASNAGQFSWLLDNDDQLRADFDALLAGFDPNDKAANEQALTAWLADHGLDGIAAADVSQALANPLPALDIQTIMDARDFVWSLEISEQQQQQAQSLLQPMAGVDPNQYSSNPDDYWTQMQSMAANLVSTLKRPQTTEQFDPSVIIPASVATVPTLVRALRQAQSVHSWWNSYGYVVMTVHDGVRPISSVTNPLRSPAVPGTVTLQSGSDSDPLMQVQLVGIDTSGGLATEIITTAGTAPRQSNNTYAGLLGAIVQSSNPSGIISITASGATLGTIDTSSVLDAGSAAIDRLFVDTSLTAANATMQTALILVGTDVSGNPQQELLNCAPGSNGVSAKQWTSVDAAYVGSIAATQSLQLVAPNKLNGTVLTKDASATPPLNQAPVVVLGPPDASLTIGTESVIGATYDATTSPSRIVFSRSPVQDFSGEFLLLQTDTPRGAHQETGKYLVGSLTAPKSGYFYSAFGVYGDFTIDAMPAPVAQPDTSPSGWDMVKNVASTVVLISVPLTTITTLSGIWYLIIRKCRSRLRAQQAEDAIEMAERNANDLADRVGDLNAVIQVDPDSAAGRAKLLLDEANNRINDTQAAINRFPADRYANGFEQVQQLIQAKQEMVQAKSYAELAYEKAKQDAAAQAQQEADEVEDGVGGGN